MDTLTLTESIDLVEAAATGQVVKPDGTVIKLGYNGNGELVEGGVFDERGRVPLHVIRPGIGRGRGRHHYRPDMLQEHGSIFTGWPMYQDHLSAAAKKAAGGQPRSIRDKGGIIKESWWDPATPADKTRGFGAGSVVGMVRPVKAIRDLIDDDPQMVEASISAEATAVEATLVEGERVLDVKGIKALREGGRPGGSVDWVSEAGAGGAVASIIEHAYDDPADLERDLIESLTDAELREHIVEARPHLLEASAPPAPPDPPNQEVEVPITKEELREALTDLAREEPTVLVEALTGSDDGAAALRSLIEEAVEGERRVIRAQARSDAMREVALARLDVVAERAINECKLPESMRTRLREQFRLEESGEPTPGLDVRDDIDAESGDVTKTAQAKLREAIEEEAKAQRAMLAEAFPTTVQGQGASRRQPGEDGPSAPVDPKETGWGRYLAEQGIDPAAAYGIKLEEPAGAGAS
jgi:hypothetical protein